MRALAKKRVARAHVPNLGWPLMPDMESSLSCMTVVIVMIKGMMNCEKLWLSLVW